MSDVSVAALPPTPSSKEAYILGVLGCTSIERALIASVCRLSYVRYVRSTKSYNEVIPYYRVAELYDEHAVDIYIADDDEKDSFSAELTTRIASGIAPVIWVCRSMARVPTASAVYYLNRNKLGTILKTLDEIVTSRFAEKHEKRPRCLVIDDSHLMRAQMELLLEEYGIAAEFAVDAESGLLLAKHNAYELIFLDVMLPEMDGYKACKLLKAHDRTKNTPVVMLTSKSSPFNRMHGALVGCDRYLTKPVNPHKVEKTLRHYGLISPITANATY